MDINSRKSSTYIVFGIAILFIIVLLFQFMKDPSIEFAANLVEFRKQKTDFFRNSPQSPLPDSLKADFKGLSYFAPDRSYLVVADYTTLKGAQRVILPENKGDGKVYLQAGVLNFKLKETACRLTAFFEKENDGQNLFIPFQDATTGTTTYGAGRYLEAKIVNDKVLLDFNKAYHPFCLFNYSFVCPLPPAENKLPVAVEAGEKLTRDN